MKSIGIFLGKIMRVKEEHNENTCNMCKLYATLTKANQLRVKLIEEENKKLLNLWEEHQIQTIKG